MRHLLDLENESRENITEILETADSFRDVLKRDVKKVPTLKGLTIANLFFEPSTRTKLSFSLAEKRLSADTVSFSASSSSLEKGESLRDTAENIEAMMVDMLVMRHSVPGAPHFLAKKVEASVINAGDGSHEHPTQALLDFYTMREYFDSFEDLKVTIVGDIKHSRVARSNIWGLKKLGAEVSICGPPTLLPHDIGEFEVDVHYDLEEAIKDSNILYLLRLQLERQQSGLIPSTREYRKYFGVDREKLGYLAEDYRIMHPGPMNRGIEISQEVADSERAIILDQVTNGVAVRMSILYLIANVIREGGKDK